MPTGRALEDARTILLDAGRRVLASGRRGALTSRSVTEESGVAKGVLHRHFDDFDAYIAALVADDAARIRRIEPSVADFAPAAVADVIAQIFTPTMLGLVSLMISRERLLDRVRPDGSHGIPLLTDAASVVQEVLAAERDVGWIRRDADTPALALALVGSAHLLFAGQNGGAPGRTAVYGFVAAILDGVVAGG